MEVFKKITELQKKFNIQFDPQIPVPEDDDLADRVFQAGVELFLSVGIYNAGSGRIIRFDKEELDEALSELWKLPNSIFIGEDQKGESLRNVPSRTRLLH